MYACRDGITRIATENLERLRDEATWDVVVIGGGATGLGSAVDAASRGYRTLLLEAFDFAHGTSSRSTKLIHGGVRYLAQGNFALVREALHERGILLRNAPHLVHRRDFVVPAYRWLELPYYGIGLKVYDWMAGSTRPGAIALGSVRAEVSRACRRSRQKGCTGELFTPTDSSTTRGWRSPWHGHWPTWAAPPQLYARHRLHQARRADRRGRGAGRRDRRGNSRSRPAR